MTVNLDYATVVKEDGRTYADPFVYCDDASEDTGVRDYSHGLQVVNRITGKNFGHNHPAPPDSTVIFRIKLEIFDTRGHGSGAASKYRLDYQRMAFEGRFNPCCEDAMEVYNAMLRALRRGQR